MPWWSVASWFTPSRSLRHHTGDHESSLRAAACEDLGRNAFAVPDDLSTLDLGPAPGAVSPVTLSRIATALNLLDVRYLSDGFGNLLAMWERHALLYTMEGPDDEILVIRARPHATVPLDFADRAYRAVNEWNHVNRFAKAYVGDPTDGGQLPIYAETQVPLNAGAHDALLVELVECGASVATEFVDWLHSEAALI
ncbi:YbjN domain-containing protein [Hamadaea flava]|uniref:YbjN domain-containing protein n=1 Tax=Hamadaea flava TaxID=1742688 RepID=A0ABV8LS24_9ACTN